jgi:hypothetical protein
MHLLNALNMENKKGITVEDSKSMKYNRIFLHEERHVFAPATAYLYTLIILDLKMRMYILLGKENTSVSTEFILFYSCRSFRLLLKAIIRLLKLNK